LLTVLSIIQEGYKLEFIEKPPQSGIRKTLVFLKDTQILLEKDAIEPVLNHEKPTGFYSTLFLVPKKNDKMRPVKIGDISDVYEILEHVDRHRLDLEIWPNLLFSLYLTPLIMCPF
jgi:hypothetical protein